MTRRKTASTRRRLSKYGVAALMSCALASLACERDVQPVATSPGADEPPGLPERTTEEAEPAALKPAAEDRQNAPPGTPPGAPPPGTALPGGAVSKSEIAKFSSIQAKLAELQAALQAKVQAGEEQGAAQQDFQTQALRLIAETGLSTERYDTIAQQTMQDPALQAEVQRQLMANMKEP